MISDHTATHDATRCDQ